MKTWHLIAGVAVIGGLMFALSNRKLSVEELVVQHGQEGAIDHLVQDEGLDYASAQALVLSAVDKMRKGGYETPLTKTLK